MSPKTATFLMSLAAATAFANIPKDTYESIANAAQLPFDGGRSQQPTISVADDVEVSHLAELATVHVAIQACGADDSKVQQTSDNHLSNLKGLFHNAGMNVTFTSPTTVRGQEDDDYDFSPRRRGHKDKDAEGEHDDPETYCASSRIDVTVHDLEKLPSLNDDLTTAAGSEARIKYIEWHLTDETKAVQTKQLRRKAMANLLETANEYAAIMAVDKLVPVEFEERYGREEYTKRGKNRMYFGDEFFSDRRDVDLSVPEIVSSISVKCKYAAVAV